MKILVSFALSLLLLFACAPEAPMVPSIDVRFSNLYYEGCVNDAHPELLPNWPKDTAQQRILMSEFDGMGERVKKEIEKFARRGSYTVVDNRELANVTAALHLQPLVFKSDTLTLPLKISMKDFRSGVALSWSFSCRLPVPGNKPGAGADPFHSYGVLLKEFRRTFPVEQIAALFYARE